MTIGQAQHCVCCGSPGIILVGDQTLCAPCATQMRDDEGELVDVRDCPDCGQPASLVLKESGYLLCESCWYDEIHPDYGDDLIL